MSERRRYPVDLVVDGRGITEVRIDPHYEAKHPDITDGIILELVGTLDWRFFRPSRRDRAWEFFVFDWIKHRGRSYRLVWCLEDGASYLGVVNCFRRS